MGRHRQKDMDDQFVYGQDGRVPWSMLERLWPRCDYQAPWDDPHDLLRKISYGADHARIEVWFNPDETRSENVPDYFRVLQGHTGPPVDLAAADVIEVGLNDCERAFHATTYEGMCLITKHGINRGSCNKGSRAQWGNEPNRITPFAIR